jgi:hypothetical protein
MLHERDARFETKEGRRSKRSLQLAWVTTKGR